MVEAGTPLEQRGEQRLSEQQQRGNDQERGDDAGKESRPHRHQQPSAQGAADDRGNDGEEHLAAELPHVGAVAGHRSEVAGEESHGGSSVGGDGREARRHQRWKAEQRAAAGRRVHAAGQEPGGEQPEIGPQRHGLRVAQPPAAVGPLDRPLASRERHIRPEHDDRADDRRDPSAGREPPRSVGGGIAAEDRVPASPSAVGLDRWRGPEGR